MQSIDKGVHRRMALRTLVSGSPARVRMVSAALEELGFSVVA